MVRSRSILRSHHPQSVFTDMETIMTLVIDEIEEITLDLLAPLLTSLRKENQDVSPLSYKLGENVFKRCAAKLKPYLTEGVQFMGIHLNDLSEIVSSICKDESGKENLLLAREVAPDAPCPETAGRSMNRSSISVMNGDTAEMRGTCTLENNDTLKTLERSQSRNTVARSKGNLNNSDSIKALNQETGQRSVLKKRGRKLNLLVKPEGSDRSGTSGGRKAPQLPDCRKNQEKEIASSSKDLVIKEPGQPEPHKATRPQVFKPNTSQSEGANTSLSPNHRIPDSNQYKSRTKKRRNLMNEDGSADLSLVPKRDSSQEKASQYAVPTTMKESEVTRNLKSKSEKGSRKNSFASKTNLRTTTASVSIDAEKEDVVLCDSEPSVPQVDRKKQSKGDTLYEKNAAEKSSGKKMVSSSATQSLDKKGSQLEEASMKRCKRKHTTPKEVQVSEMPHDTKSYGVELVGREIKVWWPLDRKFYGGVIYSFDPIEKKHMVLYADGDEEILDLRKEHWELAGEDISSEEGKGTDDPSSDALSDMPDKKEEKRT